MSRSTAINSNAFSLPCNMDERMRVFALFRAEKERSAVAECAIDSFILLSLSITAAGGPAALDNRYSL